MVGMDDRIRVSSVIFLPSSGLGEVLDRLLGLELEDRGGGNGPDPERGAWNYTNVA
jgi:hypothetical protein